MAQTNKQGLVSCRSAWLRQTNKQGLVQVESKLKALSYPFHNQSLKARRFHKLGSACTALTLTVVSSEHEQYLRSVLENANPRTGSLCA